MTNFIINGKITALGEMSVQQELVDSTIIVSGTIQLDTYIDNIISIECEKFYVKNIQVVKEFFGTSDETIIYHFTAESLLVDAEAFNNRKE